MKVLWLPSIDSTNSEALRRLPELPSGTGLAAREQTAGRGQRGNSWFVEPGKNLTFSIVLKFREGELPASLFVPTDEMWGVDTKQFELRQTDWDFVDYQGSPFVLMPDTSVYRALLANYMELICKNPGTCVRITNANAST